MNLIPFRTQEEVKAHQQQTLISLFSKLAKIPLYQKKLKRWWNKNYKLKEPIDLSILSTLPFTYKSDLQDAYPHGLLTIPKEKISQYHATSGTTSTPLLVSYTKRDIVDWSFLTARVLGVLGVTKEDVIQVAFGYGLFTGGLGFHYGASKLESTVLPTGTGNTQRQIKLMADLGVTTLVCTPSYAFYLSEFIHSLKSDRKISLKRILCGGERWSETLRTHIQKFFGARAYDNYGLTELYGPGVAFETKDQNGLYISEDYFYPEIIDPISGKILPEGKEGELVLTSLKKEAMPILRYRTGDMTRLLPPLKNVNIPFRRLERIKARIDDMIILKGVNFYPKQIEDIIDSFPDLAPHHEIHIKTKDGKDQLIIKIETKSLYKGSSIHKKLKADIISSCQNGIGLKPLVELIPVGRLKRYEGKKVRIFDERNRE